MSEELPEGWALARLRDICTKPQYGWTTSARKDGTGVRLLRTTDISGGSIDWASVPMCVEAPGDLDKYRLRSGDIVVSRAGSVGLSHLVQDPVPEAVFASYLIRFRPLPPISAEFVRAFLNSPAYWASVAAESAGIAVQNINASKLAGLEVPVPPLAEQHRIVAKVETLLGQVRRAKDRLDRVPLILKRFRQAVLAAAFSGELTESWRRSLAHSTSARAADYREEPTREVPDVPDSWSWRTLRSLVGPSEVFCYGVVQPGEDDPGGVPLIRAGDLHDLRTALPGLRRIPQTVDAAFARSRLKGGELLVTVVGANIGTASLVPPEAAGCNIARAVAKIPISNAIPEFVLMWLRSRTAYSWMVGDAREVARPTLNLQQLGDLPVPTPPHEEQREIVARTRALLDFAEAADRRLQRATEFATKLPQAIHSKALAGELVPTEAELARVEGREFESAEQMLERVRGSTAGCATRPPRRRRARS